MPVKPTKKTTKRTKESKPAKRTREEKPPAIDSFMTFHNYTGDGNWLSAEWMEEGRTHRYVVG